METYLLHIHESSLFLPKLTFSCMHTHQKLLRFSCWNTLCGENVLTQSSADSGVTVSKRTSSGTYSDKSSTGIGLEQ